MAEDERQIRMAAEAILSGSINSQRSSVTQHSITRTPDIVLSEDLIAGARHNGRMSNVRRFFCLFVTFDLLLTFLMWLICTMIAGESLNTAFTDQVIHYHITTSLFDIVRFYGFHLLRWQRFAGSRSCCSFTRCCISIIGSL